jgi:hypothetical protein
MGGIDSVVPDEGLQVAGGHPDEGRSGGASSLSKIQAHWFSVVQLGELAIVSLGEDFSDADLLSVEFATLSFNRPPAFL